MAGSSSRYALSPYLIGLLVVGFVVMLAALFTVGLTNLTQSLAETGERPVQLRETPDGKIAIQLLTNNYYAVTVTCGNESRTLATAGNRKYIPATAECDRVAVTARLPNGSLREVRTVPRASIPRRNDS